jgi:hypothetical protein
MSHVLRTANPLCPADTLRKRAKHSPIAVVRHPNCPPDLFRALVVDHPLEALQSPALALFELEAPGFWESLEREHAERWVEIVLPTLSEQAQQLWAADCAERVLPLYERTYPGDARARDALAARRAYARGEIDAAAWAAAWDAARAAAWAAAGAAAWAWQWRRLLEEVTRG